MAAIDELISKASSSKLDEDYLNVFEKAFGIKVLCKLKRSTKGEDALEIIPLGKSAIGLVCYTSKTHPNLNDEYISLFWEDFLRYAVKTPGCDGVVVCSSSNKWISIEKHNLEKFLFLYEKAL